ncbi:MAG: MinD/ParA family protein [Selenomonadales bacterium]|nr:MinD/ParA family protein [Selenomonadales bacterium]
MEDQATQLRRLMEGKYNNGASLPKTMPNLGPVPETKTVAVEKEPLPVTDVNGEKEKKEEFIPRTAAEVPSYSRSTARTIAITSGKGGVGKTNLAVNLAIALGQLGQRVVIIDGDLGMANVDILLNTESKHSMMDLLRENVALEDVIVRGPYGVSYISGGSGMEHAADTCTPQQRNYLFQKLAGCDEWADIILVDTSAGIGQNVRDFITAADEVVLITTPEPTAITDAYAMIKAYSTLSSKNNLKLVVNRVFDEKESKEVIGSLSQTARKFLNTRVDCVGYILEDRNMLGAVRKRMPLLAMQPDSMAGKCIKSLAHNILEGRHDKVQLGWQGFLRKIFRF